MIQVKVTGSYNPPPNDYDAMHSFQSRQKDGFGGKMNDKVNTALKNFYKTHKLNPTISALNVVMNDTIWEVKWEVLIEESKDGKAYVGLTSRGAAGPAAYVDGKNGAVGQYSAKTGGLKEELGDPKLEVKQIRDFTFITKIPGSKVRQIFGIYTNPSKYPPFKSSQNATGTVINSQTNKPVSGVKIEKYIPKSNVSDNTRVNSSYNPVKLNPIKLN